MDISRDCRLHGFSKPRNTLAGEGPSIVASAVGGASTPAAKASGSFEYKSLHSQKGEFRLLRLHAGQQNEKLVGSLQHFTLDACPPYSALSYTWDTDFAEDRLHAPDGTTMPLRTNLRNALFSFRHAESHCWLWIDAICIDQASETERNHQVKLMAQIYRSSNIVLAWLQSSQDTSFLSEADAAKGLGSRGSAFSCIHEDSFLACSTCWSSAPHRFEALSKLCGLRYWTRKWIIQELLTARTVVLHIGAFKFPIGKFEDLCSAIAKGLPSRNSAEHRQRIRDLSASPAVRLALDRSQARNVPTSERLLYDLVRKYANNDCEQPCDHVYALYNLIGEHRSQLEVDYSLSASGRFRGVMNFMHKAENIPAVEVIKTTSCLARLFRLNEDDLRRLATSDEEFLPIPMSTFGPARLTPESEQALAARDQVKSLAPIAIHQFQREASGTRFQKSSPDISFQQDIGPQDMLHFTCFGSRVWGLASCIMNDGDMIWHVPYTKLGFVVRESSNGGRTIIGRAYVARGNGKLPTATTLNQWPALNFADTAQESIYLDIATMFKVKDLANAREECMQEDREAGEARMKELADKREKHIKIWKPRSAALAELLADCETEKRYIKAALNEEAQLKRQEDAEKQAQRSNPRPSRSFGDWLRGTKESAQRDWERRIDEDCSRKYEALREKIWKKWFVDSEARLGRTNLTRIKNDKQGYADVDPSARRVVKAYIRADTGERMTFYKGFFARADTFTRSEVEGAQSALEKISVSSRKLKDMIDHEIGLGGDLSQIDAKFQAMLLFERRRKYREYLEDFA